MDCKITFIVGARVVDDGSLRRLLFETARAGTLVLNFHLVLRALEIACEVIGNGERIGHRKGEKEQQKRSEYAFHDRA